MRRIINIVPTRISALLLGALPFLLILIIYVFASDARLAENANDKLLPSFSQFADAIVQYAFTEDMRSGNYLLWADTLTSIRTLLIGVVIAALAGLFFGVLNGSIPLAYAGFSPLMAVISLVPPLTLLPILFIVFGLDEFSRVMLIVIGTAPFIVRDLEMRVRELPREQIIKAQTLGASSWQLILRVTIPQIIPRLIDAVRLSLGSAWLFLIAAEAIAAEQGLGYRIFLVRRYLAMDIILPYVVWITLLAFLTDLCLRLINRKLFPWYEVGGRS